MSSASSSSSSSSSTFLEGVLLSSFTLLLFSYHRLNKNKNKFEDAYWGERRGRTRVEKEMKKLSNIRLNTDEGFFVQPVGFISSCYRQCVGTPRQGLLVPHSRSSIVLRKNISPESLAGLEDFSHVWITFQFHMNTNVLKESKAFDNSQTFNAKICAPMLKGKRMGVLATRSPHRPNPVGVTLAQIRYIDKATRTIFLCACDLVEGTPVLDVKPYVPAYDTVPEYKIPDWIAETVCTRNEVTIQPECIKYVEANKLKLKQYKNEPEVYVKALLETLEADVRSKFQTKKQMEFSQMGNYVKVLFDETIVRYNWLDQRKMEVVEIILASRDKVLAEALKKIGDVDEEEDVHEMLEKLDKLVPEEDSIQPTEQPEA